MKGMALSAAADIRALDGFLSDLLGADAAFFPPPSAVLCAAAPTYMALALFHSMRSGLKDVAGMHVCC
jgi:hypothetical protein